MKLECKGYGGPYLPKDVSHNKTIHVDQRIKQVFHSLIIYVSHAKPIEEGFFLFQEWYRLFAAPVNHKNGLLTVKIKLVTY